MIKTLTVNNSSVNKFKVNKFKINETRVNEPMRTEKRLPITNGHFSYCSVEFLQFAGDYSIGLVCLPSHVTHHLQPLNGEIFESLAKAYNQKLSEWQWAENTNITQGDFLA